MNNHKKVAIVAIVIGFLSICCVSGFIYGIFNDKTQDAQPTEIVSNTLTPTKEQKVLPTLTQIPTNVIESTKTIEVTNTPEEIVTPEPTFVPTVYDTNAVAKCKDGTYSYQIEHQGSCRGHGGVLTWYK